MVAIRVPSRFDIEALLTADEPKFFTEPHYNGYPAILVRLPLIEVDELEELILDGCDLRAARALRSPAKSIGEVSIPRLPVRRVNRSGK